MSFYLKRAPGAPVPKQSAGAFHLIEAEMMSLAVPSSPRLRLRINLFVSVAQLLECGAQGAPWGTVEPFAHFFARPE